MCFVNCHQCGFLNKEYSLFCIKCGTKLIKNNTQRVSSPFLEQTILLQGRYNVIKQLGKGGMGVVYLAKDNRFANRLCVVKEMLEHLEQEETEVKRKAIHRFQAEADLLAQIYHQNIPQVYDRFQEKNRHFLVMEFVEGADFLVLLTQYTQKFSQPLPEPEMSMFLFEMCLTLEYLHSHTPQILHRDIKPENIMLSKTGKLKLVDFGIAKWIQTTRQGTSIGTQGYAAPEQYKGMVEARTDIYALGATFHHLLTGRNPQMETPFDYPPIHQLNPQIGQPLSELINHMLQVEASARPANVREIIVKMKDIYPDIEQKVIHFSVSDNILLEMVKAQSQSVNESQTKKYCTNCGHPNKEMSKFCIKCGTPL